jgi:hypothetical protein
VAKALVGGGLSVMPMAQTDLVMRAAAIAAVILALFATASGLVLHRDGWNRYRGGLFVALVTLFLLAAGPSRRVPIGPDSPNYSGEDRDSSPFMGAKDWLKRG